MNENITHFVVNIICPFCKRNFKREVEKERDHSGLLSVLIKDHPGSNNCSPFLAFIDRNGMHRGSQKIDNMDDFEAENIKNEFLNDAFDRISEMDDKLRFFHLKFPRKNGRSFEHKVGSVSDRVFMSSSTYLDLIRFITDYPDDNLFGIIQSEENQEYSGGILFYGKFFGMIYSLFWKDQAELKNKSFDDLKGYANLTIEKLLDIYNLTDLFF